MAERKWWSWICPQTWLEASRGVADADRAVMRADALYRRVDHTAARLERQAAQNHFAIRMEAAFRQRRES